MGAQAEAIEFSTSSVPTVSSRRAVTTQSRKAWDRPGRAGTRWDGELVNALFSGMKWDEMGRGGTAPDRLITRRSQVKSCPPLLARTLGIFLIPGAFGLLGVLASTGS